MECTINACKKFRDIPVSIMNFLEGTRFTLKKYKKQKSPFQNLLKPKSGGIAIVLASLGQYLENIINVTIAYPNGRPSFWDFLAGKVKEVKVVVEKININKDLLGDYVNDLEYKKKFQKWVNDLWEKKDKEMQRLLTRSSFAN